MIKDILSQKEYLGSLEKYFKHSYLQFKKFTDNIFKEKKEFFEKKNNADLIVLFKQFSSFCKPALAGYYIVFDVVNLLPRLVSRELRETLGKANEKQIEQELQKLSTIGIKSIITIEKLEFLDKLEKIQEYFSKSKNENDKKIQALIFKHWYKFGGCSFGHEGGYYLLEDYQKKFFRSIKLNVAKERKAIKHSSQKDQQVVDKLLMKYKKDSLLLKHIAWLRKFMGYRNCDEEYYHSYFMHCSNLFNEIAVRLKLSENEIWLLSKKEIIDGLKNKINAQKIVSERKKRGYTIKQVGNKISVWTGIKKEDWHEERVERVSELKGMVAFKGNAKGRVKVIFNPALQVNEFSQGDVLVTSMTTPDFVPLIKKAAAVVTDEGGLLCHAAIVSRELKTPCIIGTKIATKVLGDGALVEVDGEKGVVKIINEKSK